MFTLALYILVSILLLLSFYKNKKKTRMALKKGWKAFENILPQFLVIILIIGMSLSLLSPEVISKILGGQSGWFGMLSAAVIGSVTLIPGFVAFPLASALLENGAGVMQIAVFVSTLMAVGVITYPVEKKYFGRKITILRNSLAFVFSFVVALAVKVVLT